MVTATASVTVSLHPNVLGPYSSYVPEAFEDRETHLGEGISQTSRMAAEASQVETLELQDLECEVRHEHRAAKKH